ncbi:MAG: hypothetical protein F6K24_13100 [Okeania sp. SIO2D1]|nr:hypothetical protein [Okeania sp. SIO2D1]
MLTGVHQYFYFDRRSLIFPTKDNFILHKFQDFLTILLPLETLLIYLFLWGDRFKAIVPFKKL